MCGEQRLDGWVEQRRQPLVLLVDGSSRTSAIDHLYSLAFHSVVCKADEDEKEQEWGSGRVFCVIVRKRLLLLNYTCVLEWWIERLLAIYPSLKMIYSMAKWVTFPAISTLREREKRHKCPMHTNRHTQTRTHTIAGYSYFSSYTVKHVVR